MKKYIVVLLSALLVLGFAASVYAEIEFSGDARVRGRLWTNAGDFSSDTDAPGSDHRWYDQRVRLNVNATVAGDVAVKARVTVSEGTWDGASVTEATDPSAGGTGGTVMVDSDDYAYIVAPVGPVVIDIGRQHSSWGNKFLTWESQVDRLKVVYKVNDDWKVGFFTDKKDEVDDGDNGNDYDDYGLLAVGKFGEWSAGGLLVMYANNTGADDLSGTVFDVYFGGPAGPVAVVGEIAIKAGDLFTVDVDEDTQFGGFVAGSMNFDALTVSAALAFAANAYTADDDFQPTLFFGTKQPTAITNFAAGNGSTFGIVAGLGYKATDAINVGAKLAFVIEDEGPQCGVDENCSAFEIDGTFSYAIAETTTYGIDLAFLSPSDFNDEDSAAFALVHKLEVKF